MLYLLLAASLPSASVEAVIKEAVGRELADPYSAQFDWQPVKDDLLYCGWVNAKNQFGAYTGYQPFITKMCLENGYRLSR